MELQSDWRARIQSGKLPHNLILYGPQREALAAQLCLAYLCEAQGNTRPCLHCAACRKVAAGNHPDLRIETQAPTVSTVRALRSEAYIRPNEGAYKIYCLEAQGLGVASQNALLKLLEDGPSYLVVFFLLSEPQSLLPTLRSRCELLSAGGEASEVSEQAAAGELLVHLCAQLPSIGALLPLCVSLESLGREEFSALLLSCMQALPARLAGQNALLLSRMDLLRSLHMRCASNVGVGHLCGLLLCGLLPEE